MGVGVGYCSFGTETISILISVHGVLDYTSKFMWGDPGGPCPSIRVHPWVLQQPEAVMKAESGLVVGGPKSQPGTPYWSLSVKNFLIQFQFMDIKEERGKEKSK